DPGVPQPLPIPSQQRTELDEVRLCMMDTLSEANGTFAIHLLKILSMILLGAKGDTVVQISQALCLNIEKYIYQSFQGLLSNLNKANRKYSLRVANRLFAENIWKIPELLSGGSVDSETRLVLVNALYFKVRGQRQFDEACTREIPFKINQSEKRPVQMMYREGAFNIAYVNEVQAQVL
ncbi:hypothetical protein U0070_027726, partial [Myodes glareolus]